MGLSIEFDELSALELGQLREAMAAAELDSALAVEERRIGAGSHGAIELVTVIIAVSPATLAVLAQWLLPFAPPQPKRRKIVTRNEATGVTTTETIEYARSTPITDLVKRLSKALAAVAEEDD